MDGKDRWNEVDLFIHGLLACMCRPLGLYCNFRRFCFSNTFEIIV